MQRRDFLGSVAAGTALTALATHAATAQEKKAAPTPEGKAKKWNILVVVSDTTRIAFLGPYGNTWVKTPTLDRLARESALFERAHPECLPTIPTRRTLHSGRRAFPFRDYKAIPWDSVVQPGWQPMNPDQEVVAEALDRAGYHNGFVADVPHYFVPGNNFTRGFHGDNPRLFYLESDKPFEVTIARKAPERIKKAWDRILADAGGKLPIYPLKPGDKVKAPFI